MFGRRDTKIRTRKQSSGLKGQGKHNVYRLTNERGHEISNNVICGTSKASDQPAHTHSLIRAFASRLNIL